jgi:hypothetical protein
VKYATVWREKISDFQQQCFRNCQAIFWRRPSLKISGDKKKIDGRQCFIETVKIDYRIPRQCLDIAKISGAAINLYVRTLTDDNWKAMGTADDGTMGIEYTCSIIQERTDVIISKQIQSILQTLGLLFRQTPCRKRQVYGFNPENGEMAATFIAPLAACNRIGARPEDLTAKGIHPAYQLIIIIKYINTFSRHSGYP